MWPASRPPRVLVAGLGNIFLGDDAFGVEVVRRLATRVLPDGVRVLDTGVKTMHLAYEMADGNFDTVILVDLVTRGGEPGTVYELEADGTDSIDGAECADAHDLRPDQILDFARRLGATVGRLLIVGCEPASVEPERELSEPVAAAVDTALIAVLRLIAAVTDPVEARA